jgi:nucleoside-diphosphate-sugar epimerase
MQVHIVVMGGSGLIGSAVLRCLMRETECWARTLPTSPILRA